MAKRSRWVYPPNTLNEIDELADRISIVPELLFLGYQKYMEAHRIPLHHHKHGYEFVYQEYGSVTWEMNGVLYPTHTGEWFYTRPGEQHKARFDHLEPSRLWWIIIEDPRENLNWFLLSQSDREMVIDLLDKLPRVFRADKLVQEQLMRLKTSLDQESPHQALFARYQALDVLLAILQPSTTPKNEAGLQEAVVHTVNQMTQTPELRFSIADMANAVQVSSSHFYKLFYRIYGQSPAAYMARIRMEHACDLLKTDISITEAALKLGFETSQHFSTVFRKLIGSSPSEWRKQLKGQSHPSGE